MSWRRFPSLELQTIANATNHPVNQPWSTRRHSACWAPTPGRSWTSAATSPDSSAPASSAIAAAASSLTFDEILSDGDVNFRRLGCVNIIEYDLQPGNLRAWSRSNLTRCAT